MTTELEMRSKMFALVAITVEELTDLELAILNNVAQTDMDPRGRIFDYDKVKSLFTEGVDPRTMHEETKQALAAVVNQRLG